uniref:Uncharacterized protein n=1 Tax=Leersia perrieri TaxID=77586 RepID=A0A0D9X733_9ORYZ
MASFRPIAYSGGFVPNTLQHALWTMLQCADFYRQPEYYILHATRGTSQSFMMVHLYVRGRDLRERDRMYVGYGWSHRSAMDCAAYVAINSLRHELPVLGRHYSYLPTPSPTMTEVVPPVALRPPPLPHLQLPAHFGALDQLYQITHEELNRARERIVELENHLTPSFHIGHYPPEFMYGEGGMLAPDEYLPPPSGGYVELGDVGPDAVYYSHPRVVASLPPLGARGDCGPAERVRWDGRAYELKMDL